MNDHYYAVPKFNLAHFGKMNIERCDGPFNCKDQPHSYWPLALSEEVGEVAGAMKKLMRGFNPREYYKMKKKWANEHLPMGNMTGMTKGDLEEAGMPTYAQFETIWFMEKTRAIAHEAADVFIYLDLMAQKLGFSLWQAVQEKFDSVSDEMECPEYKIKPNNQ